MRWPSIKRVTRESKFDRHFACFWSNHGGGSKIKRGNRQAYRRYLKELTRRAAEDETLWYSE